MKLLLYVLKITFLAHLVDVCIGYLVVSLLGYIGLQFAAAI